MSVTSGPTSAVPFVLYDRDGCCWRTSAGTFHWGSTVFSGTWPTRGSMRSGACYERVMSVPATSAPGCSSLLPTPVVNDMGEGKTVEQWEQWTQDMQERHGNGNGHGRSLAIEVQTLPTPTAWLGRREAHSQGDPERWTNPERSNELSDFIAWLLPSPTVGDSKSARNSTANRSRIPPTGVHAGDTLTDWATLHGGRTNPRFEGGSEPSDELRLDL